MEQLYLIILELLFHYIEVVRNRNKNANQQLFGIIKRQAPNPLPCVVTPYFCSVLCFVLRSVRRTKGLVIRICTCILLCYL
jgi:hypothetical protein